MRKTLLTAALAAGSLLGVVSVAQAVPAVVATPGTYSPGVTVYPSQPNTTVYSTGQAVVVQPPPPPPLAEQVPAPRAGYVWAPGHYEWHHGQYVWIGGEWMTARAGFGWRAGHWEQRRDGSWQFVAGHWVRSDDLAYNDRRGPWGDRDRDGVINRDDRHPRDASRY